MRRRWLIGGVAALVIGAVVYLAVAANSSSEDYFADAEPAAKQIRDELEPLISGAQLPTRAYTAELAPLFLQEDRRLALRIAEDELGAEADLLSQLSRDAGEARDALETLAPSITSYDPPPLAGWLGGPEAASEATDLAAEYIDEAELFIQQVEELISFQRRLVGESQTTFAILWTGLPQAFGNASRAKSILSGILSRLKTNVERLEAMEPPIASSESHLLSLEATTLALDFHREIQRLVDLEAGPSQNFLADYKFATESLAETARDTRVNSPIFDQQSRVAELEDRLDDIIDAN